MYVVEHIKQGCFAFSISLKIIEQDCVNAAIVSNALPQNTEAPEREFEAKMFCCSFPKNPLMCNKEDHMGTFITFWCDQERPRL